MANNRVKRFIKDIEGLGFNYDLDASSPRNGRRVYRHPNSPDEVVRISDQMSDSGITMVRKKAEQIAGLSTQGIVTPPSIRERARVRKSAEKARRERDSRARERRAELADKRHADTEATRLSIAKTVEIERLMQPGGER